MSSDYEVLADEITRMHRQLEAALDVCRHLVAWRDGNYARLPILRCVVMARQVLAMSDGSPGPSQAELDEVADLLCPRDATQPAGVDSPPRHETTLNPERT